MGHTGRSFQDVSRSTSTIIGYVNGVTVMVLGLDKLRFNDGFSFGDLGPVT